MLAFFACKNDNKSSESDDGFFKITGEIQNCDYGKARLTKLDINSNMPVTVDTTVVENGKFSFTGNVEYPYPFSIIINDTFPINLFLENGNFTVTADLNDYSQNNIIGGQENTLFKEYWTTLEDYWTKEDRLNATRIKALTNNQPDSAFVVEKLLKKMYENEALYVKNFIITHPDSYTTPFAALFLAQNMGLASDDIKKIVKHFNKKLDESIFTQELKKMIKLGEAVAQGQQAPEISLPDTDGNFVKLSNLKGKMVLIDFWASWCRPCRDQNPRLKALYEIYKNRGFEIYGVSFDENKNAWLRAIKDDDVKWIQVSDLRGYQGDVADTYAIRALPQNMLLDREGKIVAKNIFGKELDELISGYFQQ